MPLVLESYRLQSCHPKEVIIADDGSTDGTLELLDALAEDAYPFVIKYVTRRHQWYRLASILNLAAGFATGDRILFTNADQIHCPTSFLYHSGLVDGEVGGGKFVGVAGDVSQTVGMEHVKDFSKLEKPQRAHPSQKNNLSFFGGIPNAMGIWGGNFSVPAKLFRAVNGYDEGYDEGWGGEENDLVIRIAAAGGKLTWVPESTIYHLDHPLRRYSETAKGREKFQNRYGG